MGEATGNRAILAVPGYLSPVTCLLPPVLSTGAARMPNAECGGDKPPAFRISCSLSPVPYSYAPSRTAAAGSSTRNVNDSVRYSSTSCLEWYAYPIERSCPTVSS